MFRSPICGNWAEWAVGEKIGLTVVGPESPLADGVVDLFRDRKLRVFGPTRAAAQLESSKAFSKAFMQRHGIPTAAFATFTERSLAHAYVKAQGAPIVVKADGLQKLYNLKGGLDWMISDRTTITVFALWQDEYHIDAGDVPYDQLESGQRLRLWTWEEDERTRFINYAFNMQHKFLQPGHELKAGYQYTGGGEDEYFPFTDSSAVRVGNDATFLTVFEYVHAFTADYVKPLRSGRLEAGARVALRNIPITYTLTPGQNSILDPNLGQWSRYTENVYASYLNFVHAVSHHQVRGHVRVPSYIITEPLLACGDGT